MVAAKSLVAGLLIVFMAPALVVVGGEIISAGSGGRFERRLVDNDGPDRTGFIGNFVQAGSRRMGPSVEASPASVSVAQPPMGLFAAARQIEPIQPNYSPPTPIVPPAPTYSLLPTPSPPVTRYDAFINFGTANFGGAGPLAVGDAKPWYTSDSVSRAFGHTPTAQETQDFSAGVLGRVEATFERSGLAIRATAEPSVPAAHMLSVTSGLSAASSPNAVGVTTVGQDGLSFIDKLAYANSPDELMWAVAHNVAHELMHAFGGLHHFEGDGKNLDAPTADWSTLIDPNTKFSAASVAEMTHFLRGGGLTAQIGQAAQLLGHISSCHCSLCQMLHAPAPVPEPATLALWASMAGLAGLIRSRARRAS